MTHKDNSPLAQAQWYADRVKATGSKTLYLWPRRESPMAFSEEFRRLVLRQLVDCRRGDAEPLTAYADRLDAAAQAAGYTIVEIPTRDYQPKAIRAEIASQSVTGETA